jgi:precorrin isomerase
MDSEQYESLEAIYEQIEDTRRKRDAAGRLCARSLIAGDVDSAQWQARSHQAFEEQLEALRAQIQESAPAPK